MSKSIQEAWVIWDEWDATLENWDVKNGEGVHKCRTTSKNDVTETARKMFQERKSENGIRPYFKNYKATGVLRREVS